MELVLSTIDGAVMNALAFSSTNFSSVILWIMVKKNAKDMILHLKNFTGPEINGMKIKFDLIIKSRPQTNEAMLMKQRLSTIEYFQIEQNLTS